MNLNELLKEISPERVYKLAEAARIVSAAMPPYLFHALVRTKFKADKSTRSGACRDLTGAELLEIVQRALDQGKTGLSQGDRKRPTQSSPQTLDARVISKRLEVWTRAIDPPPVLANSEVPAVENGEHVIPHWVARIWDLTDKPRKCPQSLLNQLGRSQKIFAELPDGKWYIKRQDSVAPSVKPLRGLGYIWDLLSRGKPIETSEFIGAWTGTSIETDDEITPYTEFGKSGWGITRLFDEQKEYDNLCKHFDRAIEAIGKACPELGRYFTLAIQRPSMNGEGWILHDHDPGEWILHAETDGSDAAMHKVGDEWLLRWLDAEYRVPNERIGLEYAARILAEPQTGVPCCLLRESGMADALAAYPDIKSIRPILKKHIRLEDCRSSKAKPGVARVVDVLNRKSAEALLDGRFTDSADLSLASTRLQSAIEYLGTSQRLLLQIDEKNVRERTQVKKNLDSAIDFLRNAGVKPMADHLAQHLETGEVCHYSGALTWDIQGLSPFPCIFRISQERAYGVSAFMGASS
jgi:hypothetical protein